MLKIENVIVKVLITKKLKMVISRLLIENYIFDVESPNGLNNSKFFEISTVNEMKIIKLRNVLPAFLTKTFTHYLLLLFNINVIIVDTEYNRNVFKEILKQERIENIIAIINLTHIDIYEIEGFDALQYELNCKNDHVKWFFKNKVNRHITDSARRKAELELNLNIKKLEEKCSGFEWINKDMGMFQVKGFTTAEEFDRINAPKFNMGILDFKKKRRDLVVFMCPHYTSSVKTDLIGKIIDKPINKNKGKERASSLAKIARNAVSIKDNDDSSTDEDDNY